MTCVKFQMNLSWLFWVSHFNEFIYLNELSRINYQVMTQTTTKSTDKLTTKSTFKYTSKSKAQSTAQEGE